MTNLIKYDKQEYVSHSNYCFLLQLNRELYFNFNSHHNIYIVALIGNEH